MTDKISDIRTPFFMVEDAVVTDYNLNPFEGWLYVVMVKHANRKTGELFPSVQTLMKETQMSKASVLRYTKALEAKGLIQVTRDDKKNGANRSVNHYFILQASRYPTDTGKADPGILQTPTPVSTGNLNQNPLNQIKDTAPDGDLPPKKTKAELDAEFECIAAVWGNRAGGWVSSMQGMIFGSKKVKGEWRDCQFEPPATIDEVKAFGAYARKRSLDGAMVTTAATIQRWFYDFRNGKQKVSPTPDDPDYDPRMDLSIPAYGSAWDNFKDRPGMTLKETDDNA